MGAADEELRYEGGTLSAGGTVLGTMIGVALEYVALLDDITAEEWGSTTWDQTYLGEVWVCTAVLMNWDASALGNYFSNNYFSNITSGRIVYPKAGGHLAGALQSTKGTVLTLSATDVSYSGFTLKNALPQMAQSALSFSGYDPLVVECTWLGVRDGSGDVVQV